MSEVTVSSRAAALQGVEDFQGFTRAQFVRAGIWQVWMWIHSQGPQWCQTVRPTVGGTHEGADVKTHMWKEIISVPSNDNKRLIIVMTETYMCKCEDDIS